MKVSGRRARAWQSWGDEGSRFNVSFQQPAQPINLTIFSRSSISAPTLTKSSAFEFEAKAFNENLRMAQPAFAEMRHSENGESLASAPLC